jgi:poly(A) polymerase
MPTTVSSLLDNLTALCDQPGRRAANDLAPLTAAAAQLVAAGFDPADGRDSLSALLVAADPTPGLHALFDLGLGVALLPEVAALDMPQPPGRRLHKDNLRHSITVAGQAPARLRVRWAALLHDIGKAPTRRISGDKVTFYNHEAVGERLATALLGRLGYDPGLSSDVGRLVAISGRTHGFEEQHWTDSAIRRFVLDAGDLLDDALDLSRADCTSGRPGRRQQILAQVDAVAERIEAVRAADRAAQVRPALDGNAIMSLLEVGPGPVVGAAYAHLLGFARAGKDLSTAEAEAELRRWWAARNGDAA